MKSKIFGLVSCSRTIGTDLSRTSKRFGQTWPRLTEGLTELKNGDGTTLMQLADDLGRRALGRGNSVKDIRLIAGHCLADGGHAVGE